MSNWFSFSHIADPHNKMVSSRWKDSPPVAGTEVVDLSDVLDENGEAVEHKKKELAERSNGAIVRDLQRGLDGEKLHEG